ALTMCLLRVASHHAIKIPKYFKFSGDYGASAKDASTTEVLLQSLENNHVGGKNQEGLGVILGDFISFSCGVEELPCDSDSHHFCLATSCRHLNAIASELIVRRKSQVGGRSSISFEECLTVANFFKFPNKNQGLHGLL